MKENNLKNSIASKLAIARTEAGLSQGQAAKLMHMHRPTISEIEAGRRGVLADELVRFADLYGVNIDWLTSSKNDKKQLIEEKILMAARGLKNFKPKDIEKVIELLNAIRK